MICPYCQHEKTNVTATQKGIDVIRFRKCPKCKKSFCTTEIIKPNDNYLENFFKIRANYAEYARS